MASRHVTRAGGQLVGGVIVVGLVLLVLKWALITAAILVVPFGLWWVWDSGRSRRSARAVQERTLAARRRRAEVESRAVVDVAGGCGWCGSWIAHRDTGGALVPAVEYHRAEIEEQLG